MGKKEEKKPIFKKTWFWITIGSILGAALIALTVLLVVKPFSSQQKPAESSTKEEPNIVWGYRDKGEHIATAYPTETLKIMVNIEYIRPYPNYPKWAAPNAGEEYIDFMVSFTNLDTNNKNHEENYDYSKFALIDRKTNQIISTASYIGNRDDMMLEQGVIRGGEYKVGGIVIPVKKTQELNDVLLVYIDYDKNYKAYFGLSSS